jgi:hypothetical protein
MYIDEEMVKDKAQQLQWCGAGLDQAEHILIGWAVRKKNIKEKVEEAARCFDRDALGGLLPAVENLRDVKSSCPTLTDQAVDLIGRIEEELQGLKPRAIGWLWDNMREFATLGLAKERGHLEDLVTELSFHKLASLDEQTLKLACSLLEACEYPARRNAFFYLLRLLRQGAPSVKPESSSRISPDRQ